LILSHSKSSTSATPTEISYEVIILYFAPWFKGKKSLSLFLLVLFLSVTAILQNIAANKKS